MQERYNLSDVYYDVEALGSAPYGYAYNPANTTAQWDPKNIVLVSKYTVHRHLFI